MNSKAWIIDGYLDEPACLGVPPYLSPHVRYCAGVLAEHGYTPCYCTIDMVRQDPRILDAAGQGSIALVIAGVTVPGKYLGGKPATLVELRQMAAVLKSPVTVLGGPIVFGYSPGGGSRASPASALGFDAVLTGETAAALDSYLAGGNPEGTLDYAAIDRWSVAGASIIGSHPSFPHLMCELETARGCSRTVTGGCSFCTEPFYGLPRYRTAEGVINEVAALAAHGARHFRLGRQPDLLSYGAAASGEFPTPRPDRLEELFAGIRNAAPALQTLHIDNVNPGTIARNPEAADAALGVIIAYHTPGDVAAFGMETADPDVVRANNLKAMPDDVMAAIEVLPGLNFVCGLKGETLKTYDLNESFLAEVLQRELLVRRVNIRQLMPFEGTAAFDDNTLGLHDRRFRQFKEQVRREFDEPMIRRIFPPGTLLSRVIVEEEGAVSFGRQMGSYPVLVGIPLSLSRGVVTDAVVVDWGARSVTALPVPVDVNRLPPSALRYIPGVGKKRVASLQARRPNISAEVFRTMIGQTPIDWYLSFE
jgi:radical SAM superfamily enzyme with C-terminal helix-hairpin-helix motif